MKSAAELDQALRAIREERANLQKRLGGGSSTAKVEEHLRQIGILADYFSMLGMGFSSPDLIGDLKIEQRALSEHRKLIMDRS